MKRRLLKYGSIVAAIAFLAVFYGLAIHNTPGTEAVKATDFNPGRIIDDAIFYNPDTMTVEEIQAFLDAKLPTCDMWGTGSSAGRVVNETGYVMPAGSTNADYARLRAAAGNSRYHEPPYVCVNKYYENPETHETLYETKGIVKDGMISAAQIIYNEAHKYNINPQVLLVLLKKESYVWGDTWPLKWEYNSAMGYGCPDTAPCDTAYYGFYNQVHMAAYQFDRYKQKNYEYNYHPGMINNIYYSPDYSCGTKQVYIENMATASLYIYTPYTPNDAALTNYPGTSYCGSYGNRNFFMYFSEWFGSTYANTPTITLKEATIDDGSYRVVDSATKSKGIIFEQSLLFDDRHNNEDDEMSIIKNTDNTYSLIHKKTGLAVDVPGAAADENRILQLWETNSTDAQKWIIKKDVNDNYYFISALNNELTITYSNNTLILAKVNNLDTQQFYIAPTDHPLEDGVYIIKNQAKPDYLMDIDKNGIINGTNVELRPTDNSMSQAFQVNFSVETGYYTIRNLLSNLVLDVAGGQKNDGANVQSYEQNNTCAQQWALKKDSNNSYVMINACSQKVLVADSENIIISTSKSHPREKWLFEPYTPSERYDGEYVIQSSLRDDLVLDVAGNGVVDATNVQVFQFNGTRAQLFNIKFDEYSDSYIISGVSSQKSLDAAGGQSINGTNIQIFTNNNTCAQRWTIVDSGEYQTIINKCSNLSLDVAGGQQRDGTNVQLFQSNNTAAQQWHLEKDFTKKEEPNNQTPPENQENKDDNATSIAPNIADGMYEVSNFADKSIVLDVAGGNFSNGVNVQVFTKNGTDAQKWNITRHEDGDYYTFKTKRGDKYLSLKDANVANGTNIRLWYDAGYCAQKWKIIKNTDGSYTISSKCNTASVLDIAGGNLAPGTNVQLFEVNNTNAQKWALVKQ